MTADRPTVESRTMKSAFRIKTFAVYIVGILCVCVVFDSTDAIVDSKCYGSAGLPCTTHRLSCNNNTVINIINAYYGYRPGCNNKIGLASCSNTDCCEWKINDCYKSFTLKDFQIVSNNCTGQQECSIRGRQRYNNVDLVCNGRQVSAYSRIDYTCISPDTPQSPPTETTTDDVSDTSSTLVSSSTVQPTTFAVSDTSSTHVSSSPVKTTVVVNGIIDPLTDSTNTAIVGGVLGFLCIVFIIIIILLVIYNKRKPPNPTPISDTQPTYDGLEFNSMEENTNDGQSNYDMIESSAAQINPAFSSDENVKTKTADPTYENIEQKKQKEGKKEVTKFTVNNNISEQSPNYLDVSQSPAPIYINT